MSKTLYYMNIAAELYDAGLINVRDRNTIQRRARTKFYEGKKLRVK